MFAWRKRPQTPSIPDHPRCPVTWEEALTSWQVDGVTEATTTIYRHRVRTAVAAGSVPPLAELRESDLVAWRSQVLLTVASVRGQNMTLLALRRFLSAGIAAGWVSPSFTTAMIRQHLGGVPVPRNLPLTLAAWETRIRALMQAARTSRYYPAQVTCIMWLLAVKGVPAGVIAHLCQRDLMWRDDGWHLQIRGRVLRLPTTLTPRRDAAQQRHPTAPLWRDRQGHPLTIRSVAQMVKSCGMHTGYTGLTPRMLVRQARDVTGAW